MLDGITAHAMGLLARNLDAEYRCALEGACGAIYEAAKAGRTSISLPIDITGSFVWRFVEDELLRRGFKIRTGLRVEW